MKIAICMYGQPRTWEFVKDWVMDSYRNLPNVTVVDYFVSVKNYNSNKFDGFLHDVPDDYINYMISCINPVAYHVEKRTDFLGYGAYASTMLSMFSAINLKQQHEAKTDQLYDCVVMQRYDCVCGPYNNWFKKTLEDGPIEPHTLYSNSLNSKFAAECNKYGINDRLFFGHNSAIDSLAGNMINTFNPGNINQKIGDHHATSPGVMIRDLCLHNNIKLQVCDYKTIIIRDSFDMSKGVQHILDNIAEYKE